jgi:hypothetical protein
MEIKMEEAKTIKSSPNVYTELNAFVVLLRGRLKRHVSIDDALENLLSYAHRKKPSDFAGAESCGKRGRWIDCGYGYFNISATRERLCCFT